MLITLNQVIHTTWCKQAESFEIHPDGAECTETRTLDLDGAFVAVVAEGIPFDSQVVKVVDCDLFDAKHTETVTSFLTAAITELSDMVAKSEAWENVAIEAASDQIDALQAQI